MPCYTRYTVGKCQLILHDIHHPILQLLLSHRPLLATSYILQGLPEDFLPMLSMRNNHDDGSKPPYSNSQLVGMAILRAPHGRLSVASIADWISDTFPFYRSQDRVLRNCISASLNRNIAFMKENRPKDYPKRGGYWAIKPGYQGTFTEKQQKENPNETPSSSKGIHMIRKDGNPFTGGANYEAVPTGLTNDTESTGLIISSYEIVPIVLRARMMHQ